VAHAAHAMGKTNKQTDRPTNIELNQIKSLTKIYVPQLLILSDVRADVGYQSYTYALLQDTRNLRYNNNIIYTSNEYR